MDCLVISIIVKEDDIFIHFFVINRSYEFMRVRALLRSDG